MVLSPTLTRPAVLPNREQVHQLFEQGDLVPVYRTLLADLETPVSVYMKLAQTGSVSFLLESVEGGERVGRYSFLGVNPKGVISIKDGVVTRTLHGATTTRPLNEGEDPLHAVEKEFGRVNPVRIEGLPRFVGGAVGMLSYDIVRYFERLPDTASQDLDVPDAAFMLIDTLVMFDHAKHQLIILANAHNTDGADAAYDDALRRIETITDALVQAAGHSGGSGRAGSATNCARTSPANSTRKTSAARKNTSPPGDAFQIVVSQRLSRKTSASPLTIYRALRATNPSPYMFLLHFSDDFTLVGASPEMMVRLEDGIATTRPIAGSRPRGRDEAEDRAVGSRNAGRPERARRTRHAGRSGAQRSWGASAPTARSKSPT